MFTQNIKLKRQFLLPSLGALSILLVSCGTYNNVGETDGIYSTENNMAPDEGYEVSQEDKASYYKEYFKAKENTYGDMPEDDVVFTDIEAYSTTEYIDDEGYVVIEEREYEEDYGQWGDNSENVTVNIYNTGGYGFGHGAYWGWGYPYYGHSYWNIGFGWGYGYGWGYPYYGYYGWGPSYYGGGYYNPYHYYNNNYYNNVSYNRGRRNLDYIPGRSQDRGRNNVSNSRDRYSRSEVNRRSNQNIYRTDRGNNRSERVISRQRSNSNNRVIRNTSPSRNNNSVQRNTPSRSNNVSKPSSSGNNSGSMRSSGGGSSRSSGTSGGGGRRGGRN